METDNLRPYQKKALAACSEQYRRGHRRVVLVLPTGTGKTRAAAAAARAHLKGGRDRRVVWIAHRFELLWQAAETLRELIGCQVDVLTATTRRGTEHKAPVVVASVQTLRARLGTDTLPHATFVIIDECHTTAVAPDWNEILALYTCHHLGLTATPTRADGVGLGNAFDSIVVGLTTREATKLGFLVPLKIWGPEKLLPPKRIVMCPTEAWKLHGNGGRAIVFADNVNAAAEFAQRFLRKGVTAACVDAQTPADTRARAIQAFRDGELRILTNVQILTEGTDLPDCSVIILARGCGHVGLLVQMAGRALRIAPGKSEATLVDLRGSTLIHGRPDEDFEYSLEGRGMRRPGEPDPSARFCLVCAAPVDADISTCPSCSYERPELQVPQALGRKLLRLERIQKIPDPRRVEILTKWIVMAEANHWSPKAPFARYKGMFGSWPPRDIVAEAERRAGNRTRP